MSRFRREETEQCPEADRKPGAWHLAEQPATGTGTVYLLSVSIPAAFLSPPSALIARGSRAIGERGHGLHVSFDSSSALILAHGAREVCLPRVIIRRSGDSCQFDHTDVFPLRTLSSLQ